MTPEQQIKDAVKWLPVGTRVVYEKDWNNPRIAGKGSFTPKFVMLHHTAGTKSLGILMNTVYRPVRGSHFLVDRDGTVHVLASVKAYHAGIGGPFKGVAENAMNAYAWGIEIEDLGKGQTMTEAQILSAAGLSRGLLEAMSKDMDCLIQHKEWNPRGKVDTRYTTSFWRGKVAAARRQEGTTMTTMSIPRLGKTLAKWAVGKSLMHKTPLTRSKQAVVKGGKWYTVCIIDTPDGGKFHHTLQVRMPAGVGAAEVELVRLGWLGLAKEDSTGHNSVDPAVKMFGGWRRWRTPIQHPIDGGGKVAYRILMPAGTHRMRFVAKATRIA